MKNMVLIDRNEYIHYGHTVFDRNKFKPIKNHFYLPKPEGGFWASPVKTKWGWKDWCKAEKFCECDDKNAFHFTLRDHANICKINTCADAMKLPQLKQNNAEWSAIMHENKRSYPDFERMLSDGIDAILFNMSNDHELYWTLYGWDCDSLLVLNPDVVSVISERKIIE